MKDPINNDEPPDPRTESPEDFDARIYLGLIRGDPEAWFAFHEHYSGRLNRFFEEHNVYNENDREDLLQETLVTIFDALPNFKPDDGSLRNWIYGVARNKMLQAQRVYSEKYDKEITGDVSPNQATSEADDSFEKKDKAEDSRLLRLKWALERLNENDQEILVLRSTRTATWKELALELNIGESAAKMRYNRALRKLKETLETDSH